MRGLPKSLFYAALCAAACNEAPPPTPIDEPLTLRDLPRPPKTETPFTNPNTDPPPSRTGEQLAAAELAETIASAERLVAEGKPTDALVALQRCINRTPASGSCEGLYAATALEGRVQKVWARHFLAEAIAADDPAMPDDRYRELGRLAADIGRFEISEQAYAKVIARGVATASDYAALSRALQNDPQRALQAAEALDQAYALDPTHHEWLRDRATLLAQVGDAAAALPLFERYRGTLGDDTKKIAVIDERIAALRRQLSPPPPADL